jgi:hypothetical protein
MVCCYEDCKELSVSIKRVKTLFQTEETLGFWGGLRFVKLLSNEVS